VHTGPLDDHMKNCHLTVLQRVTVGILIGVVLWGVWGALDVQADPRHMEKLSIPGWKMAADPHIFGPQDLFEHINGAADFFIAYGFISLEGAYYCSETDMNDSVSVDIYDMGEKLNAFGVFQSKRSKSAPNLNIGTASFGGQGYLAFYKDRYFVEVNSFIQNDQWKTQSLIMARQLAELLPGDTSPPRELSYFSGQGKIQGSERYIVGGILGHAFLDKGIVCNYKIGESEIGSVFLVFLPSKKAAEGAFAQHRNFLLESGTCTPVSGLAERAIISQEPYHQNILIAQTGPYMIGIYDLSIPERGKPILERLLERLGAVRPDL